MTKISNQLKAEIEQLSLLLDNRTFVDYFNIFLCLPVFGQHVFYNYIDAEFEFEPPIRNRRHLYLDRREVLGWLCTERLRAFKICPLYTEYQLCMRLRSAEIELQGLKICDEDGEGRATFTRNVIGSATGMFMFRESMRNTCGENVYRCWKDIEAWRHLEDPVKRMYWKHAIKTKYICQGSASEVKSGVKVIVYQGVLNFDLVPERGADGKVTPSKLRHHTIQSVESDDALLQLHGLLLDILTKYWLPRHLLNVLHTTPMEALSILKRPAPGDLEYLDHERRLRCRLMFPTIYRDPSSCGSSPASAVFVSRSANDLPRSRPCLSALSSQSTKGVHESDVYPVDLLSLWGGPARDIAIEGVISSASCLVEDESADDLGKRRVLSSQIETQHPVSITLKSYLGGKKRTLLGMFPKISNRIIWSLASDTLACCPFRAFLERNDQLFDLHYLNFWTDVRNYLDTDDVALDGLGQSLKRTIAHKITSYYLSKSGPGSDIFSESLKMALFNALATSNDITLLIMAQDIVQERGKRYEIISRKGKAADVPKRGNSSSSNERADPTCFFKVNTVGRDSGATGSSPMNSPAMPGNTSRPGTSYGITITEEQVLKAMELTVLCSEYGIPMIVPQCSPVAQDLVDVLHSDYSSLYVSRQPTIRNQWVRNILERPKINIETIRVSRKVILDKIDIAAIKKRSADKPEVESKLRSRIVSRRNGMVMERPNKPKSFIEVLTTGIHFDFFKRYMTLHKMNLPLLFWKAVEDLKDLSNSKTRQIKVTQIMRKFFGKFAKYGGALDCHEEIIRQIPNMDKVTPGILICAQAAVYRSMERKWYPGYLDTYPPESESTGSSPTIMGAMPIVPGTTTPQEFAEIVQRSKRSKRVRLSSNKTLVQWKNLTRALVEFNRSLQNKQTAQLLDIFLKCEVERERESVPSDQVTSQMQTIEKNIMMSGIATNLQTRLVVRNRLVILNRLPADFRFWIEVGKYQDLVDTAIMKGNISSQDTELLSDKARSIIACFLASEISPRVQINIPNDMASNIINGLAKSGPQRGMFHEAVILLFPLLYHYYRKFNEDWMKGDIPDDYIDTLERAIKDRVSCTPHSHLVVPDYTKLKPEEMRTTTQSMMDENTMKIHFSISDGVTLVYHQPKQHRSATQGGRRMTRASLNTLQEDITPRKESKLQLGKKTSMLRSTDEHHKGEKGGDQRVPSPIDKDRKKSDKNLSKETIIPPPVVAPKERKTSIEKARRLSLIVETLNKEREEKIKEQNRRYSKVMTFEDVVSAAINVVSDTNSVYSN